GGTTMGLLITSKQASDANVTGGLIDVLLAYGAPLDVTREDALDGPLANHAPRAAEKMIELGAKPDVLAAAALGRMDLLRAFFDSSSDGDGEGGGRLLSLRRDPARVGAAQQPTRHRRLAAQAAGTLRYPPVLTGSRRAVNMDTKSDG